MRHKRAKSKPLVYRHPTEKANTDSNDGQRLMKHPTRPGCDGQHCANNVHTEDVRVRKPCYVTVLANNTHTQQFMPKTAIKARGLTTRESQKWQQWMKKASSHTKVNRPIGC